MESLFLEGVRAFRERVEAPLGKLTLLVGENSTGKSTFLACVRMAWDVAQRREANFNEEPFELGTYDSIAHYHGGQGKRVKEFRIGSEFAVHRIPTPLAELVGPEPRALRVEAIFASERGNPAMSRWGSTLGQLEMEIVRENDKARIRLTQGLHVEESVVDVPEGVSLPVVPEFTVTRDDAQRRLRQLLFQMAPRNVGVVHDRPYALAPVRSRPQRTYNPIRERPGPEGEHVPALLSMLHSQGGTDWRRISRALLEFGESSGLYKRVSVRSLGKEGDPFQIQIELLGQKGARNILDVGYGVSQVLPILFESAIVAKRRTLLVQQPEVHLHPKAQAELGTYLAKSAANVTTRFVVETHSDYLVDRVAIAVRNGVISSNDVVLLFFSPHGTGAHVYPLRFDSKGDVVDAPEDYRSFFLREQARYIGVVE